MEEAYPPLSVTLLLEDDIDVSRGDMICRDHNRPIEAREIDAMVCWMSESPLVPGARYLLKHTSRTVPAKLDQIEHALDVETLETNGADELELNAIGRVRLRLGSPIAADRYADSRATGAFILIDEATNDTVGAGMVA
jgi:sulfate adenylyltransferase subunit 1 (EFTu-like GTPase family)